MQADRPSRPTNNQQLPAFTAAFYKAAHHREVTAALMVAIGWWFGGVKMVGVRGGGVGGTETSPVNL